MLVVNTPVNGQIFTTTGTFPNYLVTMGTNAPVPAESYADAASDAFFWPFTADGYQGGTVTVDLLWYAGTDNNGAHACDWEAAMYAITPGDAVSTEGKAFAAVVTNTGAPSTTLKGLVKTTILITGASLDNLSAGDYVMLRIRRLGSDGSDTMTGVANLTFARVTG